MAKSENDSICRKLHLKDFLPTEVQRLVKYRLLFQEMSKNTRDDDQETKKRLSDCIEASTKIIRIIIIILMVKIILFVIIVRKEKLDTIHTIL